MIELWRPRQTWLELAAGDREQFLAGMGGQMKELVSAGVTPVGMGTLAGEAPWSFFAVWPLPDPSQAATFEAQATEAGVAHYFDQIQLTGAVLNQEGLAEAMLKAGVPG
ncbi:hypothetical protein DMH04_04820 [Kibdelosporangium aridum]|uniref:NIPSNAP domain-containing protein n=1 Tax=Kibdelosporangium aridum TaxID=2030 RepID=A0A428ZRU2_KIBAR|nr:DUF6616 family protein [Kibdelosporangium aridum]RSM90778.1 hypothetical protein DMH04_04820 [Kibdelosporangium aridum]